MNFTSDDINKMRFNTIIDAFASKNEKVLKENSVTNEQIANSLHLREAIIDEFCQTDVGKGFNASELKRAANILESERYFDKIDRLNLSEEIRLDVSHQLTNDRDTLEKFLNGGPAVAASIVQNLINEIPDSEYAKDRAFFDAIYNAHSKDKNAGTKRTSKEYLEQLIEDKKAAKELTDNERLALFASGAYSPRADQIISAASTALAGLTDPNQNEEDVLKNALNQLSSSPKKSHKHKI